MCIFQCTAHLQREKDKQWKGHSEGCHTVLIEPIVRSTRVAASE